MKSRKHPYIYPPRSIIEKVQNALTSMFLFRSRISSIYEIYNLDLFFRLNLNGTEHIQFHYSQILFSSSNSCITTTTHSELQIGLSAYGGIRRCWTTLPLDAFILSQGELFFVVFVFLWFRWGFDPVHRSEFNSVEVNVNVSEIAFSDVEFGTCIVLLSCRCSFFCVWTGGDWWSVCMCVQLWSVFFEVDARGELDLILAFPLL